MSTMDVEVGSGAPRAIDLACGALILQRGKALGDGRLGNSTS